MHIGPIQSMIILGISLSVNLWLFSMSKRGTTFKTIGSVVFGLIWWLMALLFLSPPPL